MSTTNDQQGQPADPTKIYEAEQLKQINALHESILAEHERRKAAEREKTSRKQNDE